MANTALKMLRIRKPALQLGAALALAATISCDTRRTVDSAACKLDAFDPSSSLSVGQTDLEVPFYGGTRTKPFKIPNGRWITPLGTTVRTHPFSLRVAAHPGGRYFAVNNAGLGDFKNGWQSISFVDGESSATLPLTHPQCGAEACDAVPIEQIFGDIVYSADGSKLYAAGGGANKIHVLDTSTVTAPVLAASITVPNYPVGLALAPGGAELFATGFHKHALYRIRLADGKITGTFTVGLYPYGVTTDEKTAYVSNLGANSVSKINLTSGEAITAPVGFNPEGVTLSPDGQKLYVANSDSDTVSVINTATFKIVHTIAFKERPDAPPGISPTDILFSRDGKRIYVVLAGDNAIAVLKASDHSLIGKIPTAWYPTTVAESADGKLMAVANAKGFGAGSNDPRKFGGTNPYQDVFVGRLQKGALGLFAPPSDGDLKDLAKAVAVNNDAASHFIGTPKGCERITGPVPLRVGQSSPIKHIVYIVRENKTYDADLGDYEGVANKANGDPSLAIWGKSVTPNLHAIAERFANHDNYYSEPEQSVQGHIWAANGWSNDFSEKIWMGMWANKHDSVFLPAIEHASRGGNDGMIFNILKAGKDVRIYGEVTGLVDHMTGSLRDKFNFKYPTWSLHIRDREKAKIFIQDLDKGIFPNFVYIWLPNDHTSGCREGNAYPVSEIADNDEGTGIIIDAISKSKFWKETAVFVFEDDPQSTPDHVDGHRSILMVASPYAKRGWTSHAQVSFPSIHRTMGLILGVPATSRYEELATPLYDAFQEEPDFTPFDYIPLPDSKFRIAKKEDPETFDIAGVTYTNCQEMGAKFLTTSSLDREDQMPGLGRILWHHARGKTPYPEALVADEDDK